jgi:hypothetical protein
LADLTFFIWATAEEGAIGFYPQPGVRWFDFSVRRTGGKAFIATGSLILAPNGLLEAVLRVEWQWSLQVIHSWSGGKMTKRMGFGLWVGLDILGLSLSAAAQGNTTGVVKFNGGGNAILVTAPVQPVKAAQLPPSNLVKIYSTLGTGDMVYSTLSAIGILGTKTGQPWPEMVGNGFRPKADHIVTEVQVGATHFQGTNVLVVSLNQDNHGVPGKALHTWHFSNLPDVWTCCTLQTGKYAKGIPVQKGKLYWVVLRPEKQFQDTWDLWADNIAEKQGKYFSNNIGSGWNTSYQVLSAAGVFGK